MVQTVGPERLVTKMLQLRSTNGDSCLVTVMMGDTNLHCHWKSIVKHSLVQGYLNFPHNFGRGIEGLHGLESGSKSRRQMSKEGSSSAWISTRSSTPKEVGKGKRKE